MLKLNLTGQRFGKFLVTEEGPRKNGRTTWVCQCDCGAIRTVGVGPLRSGKSTSCGCKNGTRGLGVKQNKRVDNPLYAVWHRMKSRCFNPNEPRYDRYGGRGITVSERWMEFDNFVADMGERPEGASLDRINNDGNYEPGNCRWATPAEQTRNRNCNVLTEEDVGFIRLLLSYNMKVTDIGKEFGVPPFYISSIKHGHSWRAV